MRTSPSVSRRRFWSGLAAAAVLLAAAPEPRRAAAAPHGGHRGMKPGHLHPDLWLPDTDGRVRTLSDFGGRKLLVFHFASW